MDCEATRFIPDRAGRTDNMALTLSNRKAKPDAKPGDLIEIFRGTYQHWALYIGGDEVVHLTTPGEGSNSSGFSSNSGKKAVVKRQKIQEVVGNNKYVINNLLDDKYKPRESHLIVSEACKLVGKEMKYSPMSSNCEHFVTELRYGKPESRQAVAAALIGGATVGAGVGAVAIGGAAVGATVGVLVAGGVYLIYNLLTSASASSRRRRRK